jgi:surfeit locus 1 family protein
MVEIRTYRRRSKAGVFWLTLFACLAFAALVALGLWQLRRLEWKNALIAKVEAARTARPRPLGEVLRRLKGGEDVDFVRVAGACSEQLPDRPAFLYAVRNGAPGWRAVSACVLEAAPYSGVLVDRGFIAGGSETAPPQRVVLTAPSRLTGIMRKPDDTPIEPVNPDAESGRQVFGRHPEALARMAVLVGLERPAPYMLLTEAETPAPNGLTPAPLPPEISNRHLGYAITWFGLAAALAAVYVALLIRGLGRLRSTRFR